MDSTAGRMIKSPNLSTTYRKRLQLKLIQKKLDSENEKSHSDFLPFPPDYLPEGHPIPTWSSSFRPCHQAHDLKSRIIFTRIFLLIF